MFNWFSKPDPKGNFNNKLMKWYTNFFGFKFESTEQQRQVDRDLRKVNRDIERDRRELEREEKKLVNEKHS